MKTKKQLEKMLNTMTEEAMKNADFRRIADRIGVARALATTSVMSMYQNGNEEERKHFFSVLLTDAAVNPLFPIEQFTTHCLELAPELMRGFVTRRLTDPTLPEIARPVYEDVLASIPVGN